MGDEMPFVKKVINLGERIAALEKWKGIHQNHHINMNKEIAALKEEVSNHAKEMDSRQAQVINLESVLLKFLKLNSEPMDTDYYVKILELIKELSEGK